MSSIENVLMLWQMQKLALNGKNTVFKALAMSHIPTSTMKEPNKIQKGFIWNNKK